MACCGQTDPGSNAPQAQPRALQAADVPESMVLVEYTGTNVGSTLWGGHGATPSRRQYVFGANEHDRVKYVDQADVDYLLNLREHTKPIFKRYQEPAQPAAAPAPEEKQPAQDALNMVGIDDPESGAKLEQMAGDLAKANKITPQEALDQLRGEKQTKAVETGNMDKEPNPNMTAHFADPFTASIVDPGKPTVTSEVKAEPAPTPAPTVAPKASHKSGKK